MLFSISDVIIFNPLDSTLTLTGESQQLIKLPFTASRLLEILLSESGKVYDREFLLNEVWDKHGLTGSNGNLNQYISILRRQFNLLGINDLIQTVPRIGFMINKDVEVKLCEELHDIPERCVAETVSHQDNRISPMVFLLLTTMFLVLFILWKYKTSQPEVQIVKITYKGCNINYLSPFSKTEVQKLNNVVSDLLSAHSIECGVNDIVFFDYYNSVNSTDFGRALLSVCQKGQSYSVLKCRSFYYYNLKA